MEKSVSRTLSLPPSAALPASKPLSCCLLQNASLQTESSLLKEQLKQMENQNSSLNSQMAALQRHASTLQEQNSALHTETAKLQVLLRLLLSEGLLFIRTI